MMKPSLLGKIMTSTIGCLNQAVEYLRYKILLLWHLGEASSLGEIVIRMVRYGKTGSLGLFTKKHGLGGLKQISIIRPSYFRHRNYFVSDPLHYVGIFVMKIVQTFSVALGAFARHLP